MDISEHLDKMIKLRLRGESEDDYLLINKVSRSCCGRSYYLEHKVTKDLIYLDRYRYSELKSGKLDCKWHINVF